MLQHILQHMAILRQHMLYTLIKVLIVLIRYVGWVYNCSLICF
jgi:hypothetical protein